MILESNKEYCDEFMQRLGKFFKYETMKEVEKIFEEAKNIDLPEGLEEKLKEITRKYMNKFTC